MKVIGKPKLISSLLISGIFISFGLLLITSPVEFMPIVGVILIMISLLLLPSLIYRSVIWRVDDNTIQYSSFDNPLSSYLAFFNHYVKRVPIDYQMKINTNMIQTINVTYTNGQSFVVPIPFSPFPFFGGRTWCVCFHIKTKDGSDYTFISFGLGINKHDFLEAIDLLEKQNIIIRDDYGIIEHLKTSSETMSAYLEQIDKENKK